MAVADYKKYLAENVLNERRTVTYRSLGRALRAHSTLAKQMLYDFHHAENAKKPRSVNATYILTGIQKAEDTANGAGANGTSGDGDKVMPSSPYIPSSMPNQEAATDQVRISSVLLVREEDLEDAKSTFESLSSIYIYSLQPTLLQDLNVLTDVAREMLVAHAKEDPLEYGKQWGMIQNKNVKRRTGVRPPPPPPAPSSTIPAKRPAQSDSQQSKPEVKEERSDTKPVQRQNTSSTKPAEKAAPAKKERGSLFSSFAKAKPKLKKEDSSTPAASGAESAEPSGPEDVVLGDASDDDEEQEELFPESKKPASAETRESRKEREDRLRKMMEDDDDEDEEMPDATEPEEPSAHIDQPPPQQEDLKVEAIVKGGRRRGRRQVMKKAVKKDSEGYLVTVEEPSWESFSEDEPAPPPPKKKPVVSAPKGKAGAKAGQGNIMSFFGKK
ncbi:DNA polymerase subunit Cdc27 [Aspergillus pseudodeflectus]|uniref:DNA polymerase delta subunit 3 n=1 Tax=Aspergillus pseudodeflectus TaxID=176178 RepID=A0ABR4KXB2_9EURO